MKKLITALLTTAIAALTLAGCGTQTVTVVTPSSPPTVVETIPAAPKATAAPSGSITEEEAKAAALAAFGFAEKDVTFTKVKLDTEEHFTEYEIEYVADGCEYDVDVNAADGSIRSQTKALLPVIVSPAADVPVTEEEAKAAALSAAGLKESDVTYTKVELDAVGTVREYEIELVCGVYEYEFEVNADTGTVTKMEKDSLD